MDVDVTQKYLCAASQDKKLNIWNIEKGKAVRSYKTDTGAGEPIKVQIGPSGIHAVTSSSDKVNMFNISLTSLVSSSIRFLFWKLFSKGKRTF
jgi:WD40 repeat protein